MKTILKSRAWVWAGAVLLVVVLGTLAYIFLPGSGGLSALPAPDYWPTNGWKTSTPEQLGIDSDLLAQGVRDIQGKQIDSLTIIRDGYLVLDAYFAPYDGSFPHDVASVAKSVTTTLIGIAVDQGILQLDQAVVSFFPHRNIANLDERKKSLTIRDLVSMRNGMESGCLDGDEDTLNLMRSSTDWVQAALDRKMVAKPGTRFCYDSPGMHLLSAILQEATGMAELEFAQQNLFGPLGIQDVTWEADPQGYTHGWGDLHIKPADAAKLAFLWLHGGSWNGRQVVSSTWVSDSVRAHSRLVGEEVAYGYGWWISPVDFYALGREGQFIRVIPSRNTIVVITGGGADIGQITPFLVRVIFGGSKALPANPSGQAELAAALSAAGQGAGSPPSIPTPAIAGAISGKSYTCEDNPAEITTLKIDFNNPERAGLSMQQYGQPVSWPIGLEGKFAVAADGQAQSGYWKDENTFILKVFDIGQVTRELRFEGNRLEILIPELDMTLVCLTQDDR